jgi:hypothetical protein
MISLKKMEKLQVTLTNGAIRLFLMLKKRLAEMMPA